MWRSWCYLNNLSDYIYDCFRKPNTQACIVFTAEHLNQIKNERIRKMLNLQVCTVVVVVKLCDVEQMLLIIKGKLPVTENFESQLPPAPSLSLSLSRSLRTKLVQNVSSLPPLSTWFEKMIPSVRSLKEF